MSKYTYSIDMTALYKNAIGSTSRFLIAFSSNTLADTSSGIYDLPEWVSVYNTYEHCMIIDFSVSERITS